MSYLCTVKPGVRTRRRKAAAFPAIIRRVIRQHRTEWSSSNASEDPRTQILTARSAVLIF